MHFYIFSFFTFLCVGMFSFPFITHAATSDITFPVQGEVTFINDFLHTRGGGRTHHATDIMADKMTPVVAAASGVITFAPMNEPSYGYMITIAGDDKKTYHYIHLNNDTPGTDDGRGGAKNAYAPGVKEGVYVNEGQLLGWVGDSGNAENTAPHLHFQIYNGSTPINPYESLVAAYANYLSAPKLEAAQTSLTINENQEIPLAEKEAFCTSNSLIRTEEFSTVYYCGQDGGRYVFQNEDAFYSWYPNFSSVKFISKEEMGRIPLKGAVMPKPGSYLIKLQSVPTVYHIAENGTLQGIASEETAKKLYGTDWTKQVKDLPDSFYSAYTLGREITE
jgi:hypothetical protein